MFWRRLLSSVILLAVTITVTLIGELPLILALGIISIIGLFELYRVMGIEKSSIAIFCYIAAAAYDAVIFFVGLSYNWIYFALLLIAFLMIYVFTYPRLHIKEIVGAFFGIFYVVFTLSFIYLTRSLNAGKIIVWLIFLSAWGSDTLAYCTGMLIGKHKMSPNLSPKKSVEGLIGGIVGAIILGALFVIIFKDSFDKVFNNSFLAVGIIMLVSSAISVVGDLAASAIKRNYDIKDYGNIIPGHGGILDRFDSIIITAPTVYLLIIFLVILGV